MRRRLIKIAATTSADAATAAISLRRRNSFRYFQRNLRCFQANFALLKLFINESN